MTHVVKLPSVPPSAGKHAPAQQDCFWFLEGEGEEAMIRALCVQCAEETQKGWFWKGSELGYGDYDLFCSRCQAKIHIRD